MGLTREGLLDFWEDTYFVLSSKLRSSFLEKEELDELCSFPLWVTHRSIRENQKIADALPRAQELARGLNPGDPTLVETLKSWRKETAALWPAYMVLKNTAIGDLASICPSTNEELLKIAGIGETIVEKYGTELLEIIRVHKEIEKKPGVNPEPNNSPLDEAKPSAPKQKKNEPISVSSELPRGVKEHLDSPHGGLSGSQNWFDSSENGYSFDRVESPDESIHPYSTEETFECSTCHGWPHISSFEYEYKGRIKIAGTCQTCRDLFRSNQRMQ
jgi:hypothetical protein